MLNVNEFRRKWSDSINVKNKQFYQDDIPTNSNNAISDGSTNKENRFRHFPLSNVKPCQKHNCAKSSTKHQRKRMFFTVCTLYGIARHFQLFTHILLKLVSVSVSVSVSVTVFLFLSSSISISISFVATFINNNSTDQPFNFRNGLQFLNASSNLVWTIPFSMNMRDYVLCACFEIAARSKWAQIRARPPKKKKNGIETFLHEYCIDFYYYSYYFVVLFISRSHSVIQKLLESSIQTFEHPDKHLLLYTIIFPYWLHYVYNYSSFTLKRNWQMETKIYDTSHMERMAECGCSGKNRTHSKFVFWKLCLFVQWQNILKNFYYCVPRWFYVKDISHRINRKTHIFRSLDDKARIRQDKMVFFFSLQLLVTFIFSFFSESWWMPYTKLNNVYNCQEIVYNGYRIKLCALIAEIFDPSRII